MRVDDGRAPAGRFPLTAAGLRAMGIDQRRDTDWSILRRYCAAAYLAGFLTSVALYALRPIERHSPGVVPLAVAELAVGLVLLFGRRLPGWAVRALGISGAIVLISAGVVVARPVGPTPLWYVLPAIAVARFCDRRETLLNLGLLCVTYALALTLADHPEVPGLMYATVVSIVALLVAAHGRQVRHTGAVMAQLEVVAAVDSLTGLLNRGALKQAFAREVERAQASGIALSVALFDLDHFKAINDTFGHDAGDEALCRFAAILEGERSRADLAARMGGEEFLVVLFATDAERAKGFAERVSAKLAQSTGGAFPAFTASAGISSLSPRLASPSRLLTAADRALYAAKQAGRNRSVIDDSSIVEAAGGADRHAA